MTTKQTATHSPRSFGDAKILNTAYRIRSSAKGDISHESKNY